MRPIYRSITYNVLYSRVVVQPWHSLRILVLSHNKITHLDDSLQILPVLTEVREGGGEGEGGEGIERGVGEGGEGIERGVGEGGEGGRGRGLEGEKGESGRKGAERGEGRTVRGRGRGEESEREGEGRGE